MYSFFQCDMFEKEVQSDWVVGKQRMLHQGQGEQQVREKAGRDSADTEIGSMESLKSWQ